MRLVKLLLIWLLIPFYVATDASACSNFVPFGVDDNRRTGRMADVALNIGMWNDTYQRNSVFSTTIRSGERTGVVGLYADNPSAPGTLLLRIANRMDCVSRRIEGSLIGKLWSTSAFNNKYEGEHGLSEANMPNKALLHCIAASNHELSSIDIVELGGRLVIAVKSASDTGAILYIEGQGCTPRRVWAWQEPDAAVASLSFAAKPNLLGVGPQGFVWKQSNAYYFEAWGGGVKGPSTFNTSNAEFRAFVQQESSIDLNSVAGKDRFAAAAILSEPVRRTRADIFPSPLYYVFGG